MNIIPKKGNCIVQRVTWATSAGSAILANRASERWWTVTTGQHEGSAAILRPSAVMDWLDSTHAMISESDIIATHKDGDWVLPAGYVLVLLDEEEGGRVKGSSMDLLLTGTITRSTSEDAPVGHRTMLDGRSPALFLADQGKPHFLAPDTSLLFVEAP